MSQKLQAINYPIIVEGKIIYTFKDRIYYGGKGQPTEKQAKGTASNYIPTLRAIQHTNYKTRTSATYKLVGGTLKKTNKTFCGKK